MAKVGMTKQQFRRQKTVRRCSVSCYWPTKQSGIRRPDGVVVVNVFRSQYRVPLQYFCSQASAAYASAQFPI